MQAHRILACLPPAAALAPAAQTVDPAVAALALAAAVLCKLGVEASGLAAFTAGALAAARGAPAAVLPLAIAPLVVALSSPAGGPGASRLALTIAPPAYALLLAKALSHGARVAPLETPGFDPSMLEPAVLVASGLIGAALLYAVMAPREGAPGTLVLAGRLRERPLLPLEATVLAITIAPAFQNPGFLIPITVALSSLLGVRLLVDARLSLPAYLVVLYILLGVMGLLEEYKAFLPG